MKLSTKLLCLFLLSVLSFQIASAYNLRQINSKDGLSNSSVNCLFQDDERFLWIGTYDGLNMYDGRDISIYKPDINDPNSLSSNVIRSIKETDGEFIWVATKGGLNRLSRTKDKKNKSWSYIKDDSHLEKDKHGNLFLFYKQGFISWYDREKEDFIDLPVDKDAAPANVVRLIIDGNDLLWILHHGTLERYALTFGQDGKPQLERQADFDHPYYIDCIFYSRGRIIFIDAQGQLFVIGPQGTKFIRNLSPLTQGNGVSSAIFDNEDILVGFKPNGLYRLDARNNYEITQIDINCGVFCLLKDEKQNIVWVGTDGQGVYALTQDEYSFRSMNLVELPIHKERPVRAICTDSQGNLWLGTKENGIIRISDYKTNKDYSPEKITHFTTGEGLSSNAVFAMAMSKANNLLWIGSDGNELNYYSFADNKMHQLANNAEPKPAFVHALFEANDTLLWVGSGSDLLKVSLQKQGNKLAARHIERYIFDIENRQRFNQIYALCPGNDSIIWVGIRGNGVVRFNSVTGKYKLITFDKNGIPPMNDVLCMLIDKKETIWVGSSYGITKLNYAPGGHYTFTNYNEGNGLPNNTIHGILEDKEGKLWLSSNTGLILFDTEKGTFRNFGEKSGLKTIEFSDNAYYRDNSGPTFFFGGVDGIAWVRGDEYKKNTFIPEIRFMYLRLFNQGQNDIHQYETGDGDERHIELDHNQNFFTVSFVAMNFLNSENGFYSYKLDNFNNVWMNTRRNEAQFTNIPPGDYTLCVKYNDGANEEGIHKLRIVILPPWYMSIYAKVVYTLLILAAILCAYYYVLKKYEKKYKEEMYESKLTFFTNITHEFLTPLTLINSPCEQLLAYPGGDSNVRKYASLIKVNAERLYALIQQILDFRKMAAENEPVPDNFFENLLSGSKQNASNDKTKPSLLVVDDNKEILWILKNLLCGEYNIAIAEDGIKGLELLKKETPDLIITDIMMPNMDGITLARHIKENKHTMHIPLVMLSAKNSDEEKIEGIHSGADAYITKPFNGEYLKAVIQHLISSKKKLEQYYSSSASAFEFVDGQLLRKEDKEFLQSAREVIERNIDNTEFTTENLANELQTSVRNLYRKFKDLNQLPPNDFIKECRIGFAAKLLLTTSCTVQEVMYRTGFSNRSHFYKEFAKRYNQTPKEYREANFN